MRLLFTLIFVSAVALNARAQNVEKSKRLSIGFSVSPDYNDRTLSNNNGSFSSGVVIDVRDKYETWRLGYTAGPVVSYRLSEKVDLETGLLFSSKGYNNKKTELDFYDEFDGTGFSNPAPDGLPSSARISHVYYYIDMPVKATFNFGKKRLRVCAGAGIAANVFVKETLRLKTWYEDGSTKKDLHNSEFDYKGLMISPQASFGVNYNLNERLYLKAEPTFRYGIVNIISTPVTGKLWNAGLNLSCFFTP